MEHNKVEEIQNFLNINSNSLLKNFPHIPFDEKIYGCYELNGQIQYGFSPEFDKNIINKHQLPSYENIDDIFKETSNPIISSQNLSIIERQPLFRKYYNIYNNFGLVALLENLSGQEKTKTNNQKIPHYIVKGSEILLKIIDCIYAPINPWFIQEKEENFDASIIKGESWADSLIKVFSWHPHCNKYAVAFKNDVVKVYSINHPPVILKHPKQLKVTCLAWKPFYSSLIAIGCANCIIIWDTDNLPVSIKPSSSCSILLSKRFHHDIMDLEWYPKSDYLVSVASKDNQIMIWDITRKICIPIKRIGTTGFSICKFNSFSNRLFTADLSTTFRVWRPDNYTSEKWTNLISRCNSACWSPDGNILLFSCHDCPFIYALRFLSKNNQELKVVCDLSNVVFVDNNHTESGESTIQKYSVGGTIEMMDWDPSGQRLAVTFKKNTIDFNLNVVAVFISKFNPQFQLLPCGLINDYDGSWPAAVSFKPNFEQGALLAIGWSNGKLQHVPFYFSRL